MYLISRFDSYGCDILDLEDGSIDYCSVTDVKSFLSQGVSIDGVKVVDNKVFFELSSVIAGNVYDDTTEMAKMYKVVGATEQYTMLSNGEKLFIMNLRDIYKDDLTPAVSLPMTNRKIKVKRVENCVAWINAGTLNMKIVPLSSENTLEDICSNLGVVYKESNWYNTSTEELGRIVGYGCKATNRSSMSDCYRCVILDIEGRRVSYGIEYFNSLQKGRR